MSPLRVVRGWVERLLPVGALVTVVGFGLTGWLLYNGHQQTVDRSARVCGVLRALLVDARKMTVDAPIPKAQKERVLAFYQRYIAALETLPCERRIVP